MALVQTHIQKGQPVEQASFKLNLKPFCNECSWSDVHRVVACHRLEAEARRSGGARPSTPTSVWPCNGSEENQILFHF